MAQSIDTERPSRYHAPAMEKQRLPLSLDPIRYAKAGREIEGVIALESMPRLSEQLHDKSGDAAVKMRFSIDENGLTIIALQVSTTLSLTCQRCLEGLDLPVDISHEISPVLGPDQAKSLPEHYEPFMMEDEFLSPEELVEEELLLVVPIVPMHDETVCDGIKNPAKPSEKDDQKVSPFSVLSELS